MTLAACARAVVIRSPLCSAQDPALRRAGIDESMLHKLAARRLVTPRDVLAQLPMDLMETLDEPMPAGSAITACLLRTVRSNA